MPRAWEAEESGLFLGYVEGLLTPATRQDASGDQKYTWGSLPGPSATRPPACAHSDTGQEHRLKTKLHFVATATGSLHLANLVLSGKKERNYLDVYTQTTQKKK